MCTVNKFFKPMLSQYLGNEKRYSIARIFADLKSLRSDNSVVEFWRKSEIVDFFS